MSQQLRPGGRAAPPGRQTGSERTDEDVRKVQSKWRFDHQDPHDPHAAPAVYVTESPPPAMLLSPTPSHLPHPTPAPSPSWRRGSILPSGREGWKIERPWLMRAVVEEMKGHRRPPLSGFSSAGRSRLPPGASWTGVGDASRTFTRVTGCSCLQLLISLTGRKKRAAAASHVTLVTESRTVETVASWVRRTGQGGTAL